MKRFRILLLFLPLILIDQATKYFVSNHLKGSDDVILIPKVFTLQYLENRGAAFGILQNHRIIFYIMTSIVIACIIYLLFKMPMSKKYTILRLDLVLLASGALGNFIDRISNGFVVDFLYFKLIDFPIFNVADCYVTVSAILLFFLLLFYYKEEDLSFLDFKKSKQ